jgi:hypothetical protein
MSNIPAFGSDDRYYAHEAQEPDSSTRAASIIADVLSQREANTQRLVERAYKRWNQRIRTHLRKSTALRFVYEDERGRHQEAVPISVVDGLPPPFEYLVNDFDTRLYWLLLSNRALLKSTIEGLGLFGGEVEGMKRHYAKGKSKFAEAANSPVTSQSVTDVQEFLRKLDNALDDLELLKRLRTLDGDILGAYFFREPCIHLYWKVIGFMAGLLNVSVEALTLVVLTHELAHAYTHRGFNIDGKQWDTDDFAHADLVIVEGLAQFYTREYCTSLEGSFPEPRQAFNKLLGMQAAVYSAQEAWEPDRDDAREVIRACMLSTRAYGIRNYRATQTQPGFLYHLKESWTTVGRWNEFDTSKALRCLNDSAEEDRSGGGSA